jgi:DNA-binding GntR family transcriptional regulator
VPDDRPREPRLPSRRVEADLRERLARGEWASGERLPPVAELAAQHGVARSTVVSALKRIEADGLIEIISNWGTFKT